MESKDKALAVIASLYEGVKQEDVDRLLKTFQITRIDTNYSTALTIFTKELMINKIRERVKSSENGRFRIERNGEYGTKTFDSYIIENNVLKRNGVDAKYTSLGKLYQAYKQI